MRRNRSDSLRTLMVLLEVNAGTKDGRRSTIRYDEAVRRGTKTQPYTIRTSRRIFLADQRIRGGVRSSKCRSRTVPNLKHSFPRFREVSEFTCLLLDFTLLLLLLPFERISTLMFVFCFDSFSLLVRNAGRNL